MLNSIQPRPSSDATWIIIAASVIALVGACLWRKFALDTTSALLVVTTNVMMIGGAALIRKRGWQNVADWLTATAQMSLLAAVLTTVSYVLASTNLPLQDAMLISVDQVIGIDWRSLVGTFTRQPFLMVLLNYAYASLGYQLALFLPVAFLTGYGRAASQFVLAWSIALSAAVMISPFTPALGGYLHFQLDPKDFPEVRILAAWLFVTPFHALRDGSLNVIEFRNLDGIITFPSFHAAVAVLIAWAASGIPFLRYPMVILNLLMLVSTIPIGGHYAIDVIAGCLLAAVSIIVARAWVSFPQPRIGSLPVRAEF